MTTLASPAHAASQSFLVARRGRQWLSREDLEAHLAAVVRLENVGVLLGAGASLGSLGGKTMDQIWTHYVGTFVNSAAWMEKEGFVSSGPVNVEHLADSLEITRLEWFRVSRPNKLRQLRQAQNDLQRAVVEAALLQRAWWETPSLVDLSCAELADHRQLLQKLTAARQPGQPSPWIFTTNYDLAIEWAAETINLKVTNGFDGLHARVFSPHNFDLGYRNMLARGEARFGTYNVYLAKLHGSLTWQASRDQGPPAEYSTAHLWPTIRAFLKGDSDTPPGQVLYPSAAKYLQTVGFVLGELFRRFTEFLARPQTCLITCGYSFSDEHLNRLLITALQNPTLQLVIYAPAATRRGNDLDLSACTSWIQRVAGIESPQVTVVGGGADAYFDKFVNQLPDPAIYDEQAARIREMIKQYKGVTGCRDGSPEDAA